MQWQRVLHGFGGQIENTGRIHSVYEFTLKELPGRIIRVRVVETPEGKFYGLPDHAFEFGDGRRPDTAPPEPAINPEKALQETVRHLLDHVQPPYDQIRLVRLQNW